MGIWKKLSLFEKKKPQHFFTAEIQLEIVLKTNPLDDNPLDEQRHFSKFEKWYF